MIKTIGVSVVTALLVSILSVAALVGNNQSEALGGTTRDNWTVGAGITAATSTITIENGGTRGGCLEIKQSDGTGYAFFTASPSGNLATTTSC